MALGGFLTRRVCQPLAVLKWVPRLSLASHLIEVMKRLARRREKPGFKDEVFAVHFPSAKVGSNSTAYFFRQITTKFVTILTPESILSRITRRALRRSAFEMPLPKSPHVDPYQFYLHSSVLMGLSKDSLGLGMRAGGSDLDIGELIRSSVMLPAGRPSIYFFHVEIVE